jgi:hypothetical protein
MSTEAAKQALAALLLNTLTTPEGAIPLELLFSRLQGEGHKETALEAALFELRTEELVRVEERVEVSTPEHSLLHDIPDDVFLTPLPKPEPTTTTYRIVWPLPALQEWWKRQSGQPSIMEGAAAQANPSYTLGELIRELEGHERAFAENSRTADRVESEQGSLGAVWWRVQAAALRFQPDPARMSGIDRIEVLCDEIANGKGLTAANVRQLRARLCRLKRWSLQNADNRSLVEAADALEAATPDQPEPMMPSRSPADPVRYEIPAHSTSEPPPNGPAQWEADPVQALQRLRDCTCDAANLVIEAHRWARLASSGQSMADIAQEPRCALYQAIVEAQAIWFDTPAARYLDRPEGPVNLDHLEGQTVGRVSGSCHHDLALSLAVGLLRWIEESLPAADYVAAMRYYTAAGDHVGQHLAGLVAQVRCECQRGIARWKAEGIPTLQGSNFSAEKLDPSRCPGCKAPVPEEYSTLAKVPCLSCRRWELHTGLLVIPVAASPGTPPEIVRHSAPFWQAILPDPPESGGGKGEKGQEKEKTEEGSPLDPAQRNALIQQMEPSVRLAYLAFCYAETRADQRLEDREAYSLLKEEGIPDNAEELAEYRLPSLETWARYLRQARTILDERKYTRRTGRRRGGSVVTGDQVEYQKGDNE